MLPGKPFYAARLDKGSGGLGVPVSRLQGWSGGICVKEWLWAAGGPTFSQQSWGGVESMWGSLGIAPSSPTGLPRPRSLGSGFSENLKVTRTPPAPTQQQVPRLIRCAVSRYRPNSVRVLLFLCDCISTPI